MIKDLGKKKSEQDYIPQVKAQRLKLFWVFLFLFIGISSQALGGFSIDANKLADAIFKAEGGYTTKHPYGILVVYKHTSPRQACINTINHALKDWNGQGDFIEFLGSRYCPIGAKNDPTGLNKNWVKNVRYFYEKTLR